MVVPTPPITQQELHTADGRVYAHIVPAEEFARLQAEMQALREQVATLQRQKNHYVAELIDVLKTWMPIPPTEEELNAAVPNSEELSALIVDMERKRDAR